jgi:hypothetical protein
MFWHGSKTTLNCFFFINWGGGQRRGKRIYREISLMYTKVAPLCLYNLNSLHLNSYLLFNLFDFVYLHKYTYIHSLTHTRRVFKLISMSNYYKKQKSKVKKIK